MNTMATFSTLKQNKPAYFFILSLELGFAGYHKSFFPGFYSPHTHQQFKTCPVTHSVSDPTGFQQPIDCFFMKWINILFVI